MNVCPMCRRSGQRAILAGLPMWLCDEHGDGPTVWGFWTWLAQWLPWDGSIVVYSSGRGLRAWWAWFTCEGLL